MSKYIMFTKDVGDYKSGEYSQVEDPVAKQFIDMKVAEAAPEDPIARTVAMSQRQVMASIEAQFQKQMEEQKAQAKKYEIASRDFARPKHNFAIGNPDWTSEKDKIRNQPENEWFRSLVYAICRDVDPEVRKQKHDFLTTDYNEGGWGCRAMAEGTGSLVIIFEPDRLSYNSPKPNLYRCEKDIHSLQTRLLYSKRSYLPG